VYVFLWSRHDSSSSLEIPEPKIPGTRFFGYCKTRCNFGYRFSKPELPDPKISGNPNAHPLSIQIIFVEKLDHTRVTRKDRRNNLICPHKYETSYLSFLEQAVYHILPKKSTVFCIYFLFFHKYQKCTFKRAYVHMWPWAQINCTPLNRWSIKCFASTIFI